MAKGWVWRIGHKDSRLSLVFALAEKLPTFCWPVQPVCKRFQGDLNQLRKALSDCIAKQCRICAWYIRIYSVFDLAWQATTTSYTAQLIFFLGRGWHRLVMLFNHGFLGTLAAPWRIHLHKHLPSRELTYPILGNRKIIFKRVLGRDMLVPKRVKAVFQHR